MGIEPTSEAWEALNKTLKAIDLAALSSSTAILCSNTAYFDPEFKPQTVQGVPLAVIIDVVYLSAVVVASWFGFRGVR